MIRMAIQKYSIRLGFLGGVIGLAQWGIHIACNDISIKVAQSSSRKI